MIRRSSLENKFLQAYEIVMYFLNIQKGFNFLIDALSLGKIVADECNELL